MRKFLKLTFDFINSAKLKILLLALIFTLTLCALAFMCGRLMYTEEKYEKLVVADIENMLYFSVTVPQSDNVSQMEESLREIKESILATDGVVSILERQPVFRHSDPPELEWEGSPWFYALRITEELYEKFEPVIAVGKGFDYSSPDFEMIVTGPAQTKWQEDVFQVGTGIGFSYGWDGKSFARDENGNTISQYFDIIGIAEPGQFYPTMESADQILTQVNVILIKDNEYTHERLDGTFPESIPPTNECSGLVELKAGISAEGKQAVIEAIQKFGSNDEGDDLLSKIKSDINSDMSLYLPVAATAVVFCVAVLIFLASRSIRRYADDYAIWRMTGSTKKRAFFVTFAAFFLVIAVSLASASAIVFYTASSESLAPHFVQSVIGAEAYLVMAGLAAAIVIFAAVVSALCVKNYLSVKEPSPAKTNSLQKS